MLALAGHIPRRMNQHVYRVPAAYVIHKYPVHLASSPLHQTFYHIAFYLQHDAPS